MSYVFLCIAILFNSLAHFTIKNSAIIADYSSKKIFLFFLGAFFFGVSLIFYMIALSKINLSIAFPISLGLGTILTTILAYCFLNESISIHFLIGVAMILLGTFVITRW